MIIGLDLVELQYNTAFRSKMTEYVNFDRHSIEYRITTEDPEKKFMPVKGQMHTNFIPMYFNNWKEEYKPVPNQKIASSIFNKYRHLIASKPIYKKRLKDLLTWVV
ncbi:MAG: hypothetical protein RMJ51_01100 [Candidatus Calescibacterium sp.]|nr:hypothetical protein [Candidatus Calescibacterium sp.]MCX7972141.1 hypothetical protein [bacterium]MDW8194830.1 hypothetical protein [Candidatus Calescibacterium sp.]